MTDLNGQFLQHFIEKRMSIILEQLACYNIMEISTTGMDLRFY